MPTGFPTRLGQSVQVVQVQVGVCQASIKLAVTTAQFQDPETGQVFKEAIEAGIGFSIGIPGNRVTITMVNGQVIATLMNRKLTDSSDVSFEVQIVQVKSPRVRNAPPWG